MTSTCINLQVRFGQQYRISHDEAASTWGERADPWMMTIPGRWGTIYPHCAEMLALELDGHPKIAKQVAEISGIVLHIGPFQSGIFPYGHRSIRPIRRPLAWWFCMASAVLSRMRSFSISTNRPGTRGDSAGFVQMPLPG